MLLCFILQVVSGKVGEWVVGYVHYAALVSYYFNVIHIVNICVCTYLLSAVTPMCKQKP